METENVLNSLANAGLGKFVPDIQNLLQESIRIQVTPAGQTTLPTGSSHLGGNPDLPFGFAWPVYKGIPMSFIGQLRLEDLAGFEPAKHLPDKGLLSFFYDANQDTYGDSPDNRGGWRVEYFSGLSLLSLHPTSAPTQLPETARFTAGLLKFSSELTLPTSAAQHIQNLTWTAADVTAYENFLSSFPTNDDYSLRHHRMFGHPNQIQDDMQLQSVLFINGVPSQDDPRAAELAQSKEDWLLLLQVDTDDTLKMRWSSSGMLYFWINASSLKDHKFDETWLVLQAE